MDEQTRVMPGSQKTKKSSVPFSSRKQGVIDLISMSLIPLAGMAAVQTAKEPENVSVYALDAMAIEMQKEPIADAVVELANTYPVLGAVLDKIAVSAPISALIASVMTLGLQIAENHRTIPDNARSAVEGMGVIPREILAMSVMQHAEKIRTNGES